MPEGKEDNYSPNGSKWISTSTLSGFDLEAGDELVATLDLTNCTGTKENLLSIGTNIAQWSGADNYVLHIYYTNSTGETIIDYNCDEHSANKQKLQKIVTISEGKDKVVLKLTKEGFYINNDQVISAADLATCGNTLPLACKVDYTPGKEGRQVLFRKNGTKWVSDANGYLIIDDNGEPYAATVNNYIYADDANNSEYASVFISRRVHKDASSQEGPYLAFASFDEDEQVVEKKKITGVYTDRSIMYGFPFNDTKYASWTLTPTNTEGDYMLSITMDRDDKTGEKLANNATKTYYLVASSAEVTGATKYANQADKEQFYYYSKPSVDGKTRETVKEFGDMTATGLSDTQPTDDNGHWRLISLADYQKLLIDDTKSELQNPIDMSILISDYGFSRGNLELADWKASSTLAGSEFPTQYSEAKLRIGYDGYYKTNPSATSYYKGSGYNYDATDNTDYGTRNYDFCANHSRYMCATVQNGGYGRFSQTITLTKSGWYIIKCQGMSTAGASLFAEYQKDGKTKTVTTPLTVMTDAEYQKLQMTDEKDAWWPYDVKMPMYNAAVAMSDIHTEPGVAKYSHQVAVYIDCLEGKTSVTLGVEIPQTTAKGISSDFTAFTDFRLYYSAQAKEPYLILDEDNENLDYLDKTIHRYRSSATVSKKLCLNRTFKQGKWNTIMLPVGLTKQQFDAAFGEGSELAELHSLTSNYIRFKTVQSEEQYGNGSFDATSYWLKPMTAYIIKPTVEKGTETTPYTAELFTWASGGKEYITQTIGSADKPYFLIDGINMVEGIVRTNDEPSFYNRWDFAGMKTDDDQYAYVMKGAVAEGNGTMTAYGYLARNYTVNPETNSFELIDGRDPMADAYTLMDNVLTYLPKGTKSKGFRCYFKYTKPSDTKPVITLDGIDLPTSIDELMDNDEGSTRVSRYADGIFTMNGQLVSRDPKVLKTLPKGLYLVNGKKYVVE